MQPYQEASQEIQRQGEFPLKIAKTAGSLAATAIGGGAALSRIMPFLNKYIPKDLAIKGLSKVDPRFGKFINKALSGGYSFDEVSDFIKGKAEEGGQQEPAKENRNIIEQYSPELHEFMSQEIAKGRTPIEAGELAQNDKRFSSIIKKLSKDHKTPWSNILEGVYGNGQQAQQPQTQQQQMQQPVQPQQQGQGQGQQALMSMLQKINQRLGSP